MPRAWQAMETMAGEEDREIKEGQACSILQSIWLSCGVNGIPGEDCEQRSNML